MACKDLGRLSARVLLSLVVAGSILLGGCKTQEVSNHWSSQPVQVDGQMTDWAGIPANYLEDSGVQLGLCYDNQNLYILFRFSNQAWARAIRMGGVTLWLDNSGKKKKDFGIRYTGGPSLSEMQGQGMAGEGGFWESLTPEQKERLKQRQASMADQITVIDKKRDQEIALRADGSGGPAFGFANLQGIYTYEFSIPLQKGDVFDYGIGAEPGQIICLGLEWGLSEEDRQRMMKEMGGGPPRGGRGDMGGGLPGGGRGGMGGRGGPGGGSRPQMPGKQEVWVKTVLATSPTE